MADAAPGLARQGSVARTNAVAMLRRAASQREVKARAETPAVPGAFPSEPSPPLASSSTSSSQLSHQLTSVYPIDAPEEISASANRSVARTDIPQSSHAQHLDPYPAFNAVASTSVLPPTAMLATPSPNESSDRSHSPMFLQDRSNQRTFNRSPLPSLEQLRARILLERESEGVQRSTSTSAASQAARAYALEKLLGNSGSEVFYDHTHDGTRIGRGAATPSPTRMSSGQEDDTTDMASDDEAARETRLKRQSVKGRPSLRRSRTVNGLTAMAEAQNKANFVKGVFLAVPGPAAKRISRILQKRIERQSMLKPASSSLIETSVTEESGQEAETPLRPVAEAVPSLSRQQSQRQIARTEMMRKLSTRGRGNSNPAAQSVPSQTQATGLTTNAPEQGGRLRLPQVITNSPAVDETISPVGVVIRPPSSPVPPYISIPGELASPTPASTFRQALEPAGAAGANVHAFVAASPEMKQPEIASTGLNASSSAASLASQYAHSTATNATSRHNQERNRESAMARLNNEDSFALEVSPSMPSTSIDAGAVPSSFVNGNLGDSFVRPRASYDGDDPDDGGLRLDLSSDSRIRRRAALVGLGLASVPSQATSGTPSVQTGLTEQQMQTKGHAGLSPNMALRSDESGGASVLRRSLTRLNVPQPSQDMLSSPGSYTDEEMLEDDDFYQLYSPAVGVYTDEGDESDEDNNDNAGRRDEDQSVGRDTFLNASSAQHDIHQGVRSAAWQSLGLASTAVTSAQRSHDMEFPKTPPQRLFHRGIAAVPVDPSPGTETEFGETRRTPWMDSSPGGFNLPFRLSNSLMTGAETMSPDLPATDPGRSLPRFDDSRRPIGDWPMSVASSGTLHLGRESLESRREGDSRRKSSEEGRAFTGAPAIGSPLMEVSEDETMNEAEQGDRHSKATMTTNGRLSDFELLTIPSSNAKPSDRVQQMLGSSFVAEYGADLDQRHSSRPGTGQSGGNNLLVPASRQYGSASNTSSKISINDLSDADGEVNDDYLRKVDRVADKLGKLARANTVLGSTDTSASVPRSGVAPLAPRLERSNTNGSRFTERMSAHSVGHLGRPSADLSALIGNEKLHPFPGLSLASPVQSQDGFSHMSVSKPSSSPALTAPAVPPKSDRLDNMEPSPLAFASKDDQEDNGKQIGLFSSLRRKASTLRRTPSSAKEGPSFWARRGRKEDSPKLPTEATFISAPILTSATTGTVALPSQPIVTVSNPPVEAFNELAQRERHLHAKFEHESLDRHSTDNKAAAQADLQRNASVSSMVSARFRTDLQDSTVNSDGSSSSNLNEGAASLLAPNTAAMIHRYSRMLSTAGFSQTVPGATHEDMQNPPRKLLATDPVFQVISATTIKDRFLFLFSDILIIAKPVAAPGAEAGQTLIKMKQAAVLPSLSWKFSVKRIIELRRLKVSVTSNTRASSAKTRAQNPVLWGFVSHFSKDPDAAVRALVAKSSLEPIPASIAQLLYQTPELDRHDLTQYLSHPLRREILKAYVSQHRHVGVSIESALRTLLLDLRFPSDLDAFEALLMHFAQSWTQHNTAMIKPAFTAQIASDLVFAIMALNDALHTGSQAGPSSEASPNFPRPATLDTPGFFSAPCPELSKSDFVSVFRQHDPEEVLSDRTLSRIYLSIRTEPLVQALDRFEPRFTVRVKGGKLPTRLTYAQPAEPVTLVIPAPDPDLAIRLYAQDTTFEPPVLTFAGSNEASFTMWTKSLGPKQVVFVRAGRNARFYAGTEIDTAAGTGTDDCSLPRSFNMIVERAFMKHSFTLTTLASSISAENGGGKGDDERFMFSFESGEKVDRWTKAIRDRVEECVKQKAIQAGRDGGGRGMEMASLQVLRETLVSPEDNSQAVAGGGLNRALTVGGVKAESRAGQAGLGLSSANLRAPTTTQLDRIPSTSRHYYASSGVGRHERELLIPPSASSSASSALGGGETRSHTKGSASLSLYPPSTSVTRVGATSVARSNSARSASSPLSPLAPLPPMGTSDGDVGAAEEKSGRGEGEKAMQGSQIVSISRLNSLLVQVVAHHQQQQQQQQS